MGDTQWKEAGGDFGATPRWTEEATTEFEKANTQYLGTTLEGLYVEMLTGIGAKGANMYVLETEAHGKVSVFGSTVLDGKFKKVPVGSQVKIEYLGKEKAKSGNEYNNFKVLFAPAPLKEVAGEAKF